MATDEYFIWLCSKIRLYEEHVDYTLLIGELYQIPYTVMPGYTVDEIRVRKTEELYTEFVIATGIVSSFNRPFVSVLEVLISLAEGIEESVMRDSEFGDRTPCWFWDMVSNLGLLAYDDFHFDLYSVREIIRIFVERRYSRNGRGSIAYTTRHTKDFRKLDIWQQLSIYFSEKYIIKENGIHGSII